MMQYLISMLPKCGASGICSAVCVEASVMIVLVMIGVVSSCSGDEHMLCAKKLIVCGQLLKPDIVWSC